MSENGQTHFKNLAGGGGGLRKGGIWPNYYVFL